MLKKRPGLEKVVDFLANFDDHQPNQLLAKKLTEKWAGPVKQSNDRFGYILLEF